jgi:hypothetical protein
MVRLTVPSDDVAPELLVAQARAVARTVDADPEAVGEVVRQVAADAVARTLVDRSHSDLTLIAITEGTELVVRIEDDGAPISGPTAISGPSAVAADGGLHRIDASIGDHANITELRFGCDLHHALLDHADLGVVAPEAATSSAEVVLRALRVDDALELSRLIYRCYGWSYPGSDLYYPNRVAAAKVSSMRSMAARMTAAARASASAS